MNNHARRVELSMARAAVELRNIIEADIGPPRPVCRLWVCPFCHSDAPSLRVSPRGTNWSCSSCRRRGDALDWVAARREVTLGRAAEIILADSPAKPVDPEQAARQFVADLAADGVHLRVVNGRVRVAEHTRLPTFEEWEQIIALTGPILCLLLARDGAQVTNPAPTPPWFPLTVHRVDRERLLVTRRLSDGRRVVQPLERRDHAPDRH